MPLTIHVHVHGAAPDPTVLAKLDLILKQGATLMATAADITAKITAIKTGLEAVAADITRIKDAVTGGLTAAEADAVVADLDVVLARVSGIDAETPEA